MSDFLLIIGGVVVLLPFFYIFSSASTNIYYLLALILVLIPTTAALINGAPFVPTPISAVKRMIKIAKLKKGQKVYDIGCGDGRIVYIATKNHGVKATGFELSPFIYLLARIRKILWKSKAKIKFGNFKWHDLSDADVIFCYLMPGALTSLEPKLSRELKPGAKVISYAFRIAPWKEVKKHERDITIKSAPIWEYEIK